MDKVRFQQSEGMPEEVESRLLAEAKEHAAALLALIPSIRMSLKAAGINSNERRLLPTLESNLIRLIEQASLADSAAARVRPQPAARERGIASLYGAWHGLEISEEEIEAARFRGASTDA